LDLLLISRYRIIASISSPTLPDALEFTNLYLCGSGAHPGGGVMGAPGHNAAREILKDWKRLSRG